VSLNPIGMAATPNQNGHAKGRQRNRSRILPGEAGAEGSRSGRTLAPALQQQRKEALIAACRLVVAQAMNEAGVTRQKELPGRAQTSNRQEDNHMKTAIQIEVRPTELDNMGHVNNAKFLEYMEWSREDWYNKAGLPFDTFTALGLGTVTVNININYRKEARLGQHLTVSTEPIRKRRTSFVLKQVIINANEELVADAEVVIVTIDLQSRKASPLPDALAKMFS
jgi:thioesterase-3